jgi:hypothetical protein
MTADEPMIASPISVQTILTQHRCATVPCDGS